MRVLITGANGQVGTALQRTAPAHFDLNAIGSEDCDLTDSSMLRARLVVEAPDIIINAAAYTAVDQAESEEARAGAVNAEAVGVMVESLQESGGKLVHVSTDFVFDGESARAYLPEDRRNPLSAYGRTKAAGEDLLRQSDLCVRTSWVYSATGNNFVRTMLRLMAERDEIGVVVDQISAPTWATSLAKVIWELVDQQAIGLFHYSDAGMASWYDFAEAIAEEAYALGMLAKMPSIRPIMTSDYPTSAKRPCFSLLNSQATHSLTGTEPTHWRRNLRQMLAEEKSNV